MNWRAHLQEYVIELKIHFFKVNSNKAVQLGVQQCITSTVNPAALLAAEGSGQGSSCFLRELGLKIRTLDQKEFLPRRFTSHRLKSAHCESFQEAE